MSGSVAERAFDIAYEEWADGNGSAARTEVLLSIAASLIDIVNALRDDS